MTSSQQTEMPATVFDIDALLKQCNESFNIKIAECLVEYRAAKEEASNALGNKQRFEKAGAASRAAAEAINLEIRTALRQGEVSSKEAHKKRSERAGHLDDVEIYKSMMKESDVSIAAANLRVSRLAGEIVSVRRQALSFAQSKLSEVIAGKLNDEFRAIAIFVNLTAEIAGRGDSEYYNARGDVFKPMDFALDELAKILRVAFVKRDLELCSGIFLSEIPEGLGGSLLSPLAMKKMEDEISAMEATL